MAKYIHVRCIPLHVYGTYILMAAQIHFKVNVEKY